MERDIVLSAERVSKQVSSPEGPLTIVRDVSFTIRARESVAIAGPSGAGKSTLLALLAGLDTVSSGKVWLAGADLTTLDEDGRARLRAEHVGFVFQSFHLVPALTALENVMLPLELRGRADARERAHEMLARVGLAARVGHYPRQLSGGEQQRVAMARAAVGNPTVLFADEPTGNLDTVTGERVIELLFELNAAAQTTLVLVTHDPALAARCGRVLRHGRRSVGVAHAHSAHGPAIAAPRMAFRRAGDPLAVSGGGRGGAYRRRAFWSIALVGRCRRRPAKCWRPMRAWNRRNLWPMSCSSTRAPCSFAPRG